MYNRNSLHGIILRMPVFLLFALMTSQTVLADGNCLIGSIVSSIKEKSLVAVGFETIDDREYYYLTDEEDLFDIIHFSKIGDAFLNGRIVDIKYRYIEFEDAYKRRALLMIGDCYDGI